LFLNKNSINSLGNCKLYFLFGVWGGMPKLVQLDVFKKDEREQTGWQWG
jgi:hypothetical protein